MPPPSSAQRWPDAHLERGLDGRTPREAKGADPELTPDLAPVLNPWVIGGPAGRGPDRANRTDPESADHPYEARGIRVGRSALRAFGAEHGIRPYRPTYRFVRGDPARQAAARGGAADPKKGRTRATPSR